MLNFTDFKVASCRLDEDANNNVHFFSRYIAVYCAYFCYRLHMNPNQVTGLFLISGVAAALCFTFEAVVLGYLFWRLHIILDMADGTVARATRIYSRYAQGFDRSNHLIINTSILMLPASYYCSPELILLLVISCYLYSSFSRNFISEKANTQYFRVSTNLLKNAIGFEGYIILIGAAVFLNYNDYIPLIVCVYSVTFLALFLIKLYRY